MGSNLKKKSTFQPLKRILIFIATLYNEHMKDYYFLFALLVFNKLLLCAITSAKSVIR